MLSPVGSIAKQNIHGKKVLLLCKIGLGDHLKVECSVDKTTSRPSEVQSLLGSFPGRTLEVHDDLAESPQATSVCGKQCNHL